MRNKNCIMHLMIVIHIIFIFSTLVEGQNNTGTTTSSSTRLRIAIPVREFTDFVSYNRDPNTGEQNFSGFALELFKAVANTALASPVAFAFIPFAKPDGTMNGTFDDMLEAVFNKEYDGAAGEIGISYYRTQWVDYTLAYMDYQISMMVPLRQRHLGNKGGIPFAVVTKYLVIATIAFSFCVAILFWILEYRNDKRISRPTTFAPPPRSSDVDWQKEILTSMIQTRLVNILFFMVLLVFIVCYITAQTSSFSTSHRSSIRDLDQLIRLGSHVGYRKGAYYVHLLIQKGFTESQLMELDSEKQMIELLNKGTANGGIDAVVADNAYLKLFLAKHCDSYTIIPTVKLHTGGFGFAFSKDTSYANEFSKGILKVIDDGQYARIQAKTIGDLDTVCQGDSNLDSNLLNFDSLWILVLSSIFVLMLVIIVILLYCGVRKKGGRRS